MSTTWPYALTTVTTRPATPPRSDPRGNATRLYYDAKRRLLESVPAAFPGNITSYGYDPDDRPTRVERFSWKGGSSPWTLQSTVTAYTPSGQRQTVTDANHVVTTFAYDVDDRLANTTMSSGRQV